MELLAVIKGLEILNKDNLKVKIYSDSKYVVDAVNKKWLNNWIKTDFKNKKNEDLWRRFYNVSKKHTVELIWIKWP